MIHADKLPPTFDLIWDIKSRAELVQKMADAADFLRHATKCLDEYFISLTPSEIAKINNSDDEEH